MLPGELTIIDNLKILKFEFNMDLLFLKTYNFKVEYD